MTIVTGGGHGIGRAYCHGFAESLEIDPNYAPSWREWAISLYRQERFSEAWIKAKRAQELKAEPFPTGFLKDLESKIPPTK